MVKLVEPSVEIITPIDGDYILKHLELCARNCYKSEDKITTDSAKSMIKKLLEMGHEAMIEHFGITVKLTTDVGAYKDLTRHRMASFAIESTRFCNYSKGKYGNELTFMKPSNMEEGTEIYNIWYKTMEMIEKSYLEMAEKGAKADQLRMMLPHSTKADVIMTMDAGRNSYDSVEIAEIFSKLGARYLLPTRMDLTRRIGAILSVAGCTGLIFCAASVSAKIAKGMAEVDSPSLTRIILT